MNPTLLCYLILIAQTYEARDAISEYVRHRKIYNFSLTVLKGDNTIWFEHTYHLLKNIPIKNEKNADFDRVLKIGISPHKDYLFDFRYENEDYKGYTVELLKISENLLNFTSKFIDFNKGDNENKSIEDALLYGDIDVIFNHDSLAEDEIYKFIPTLKSRFALIYKPSKINFVKDIFILTFAGSMWLVFLTVLIVLAFCLRISTYYYYIIYPVHEKWTWVEITLWAIAAACQQGLSYTPYKFGSCLIFLLGYVMSYLLYTGFTAGITSTLLQEDTNQLNIYKLNHLNLKAVGLNYITNFDRFENFKISTKVKNMEDLFARLENQNTVGVAPLILIDEYLMTKNNVEEVGSYATTTLPCNYYRGAVIKNGSRWKPILSKSIFKLQEMGILQNILNKNLLHFHKYRTSSTYSSAGFEHIASAIMLFLAGALLAIVFLTTEFIFAYFTNHVK